MSAEAETLLSTLPQDLRVRLSERGRRGPPEETLDLVVDLCRIRDLGTEELAVLLDRDRKYVMNDYIRPLLQSGRIAYTIPEQPRHPAQRYRATDRSDG